MQSSILGEIVQYFTYPLYYTSDLVSNFYLMLMKVVQSFRTFSFLFKNASNENYRVYCCAHI